MRVVRVVTAAAVALGLAGCTGLPADRGVRVVRRVPAAGQELPEPRNAVVRVARPPLPDAPPLEIVRGYLAAQTSPQDDHAIARQHLASGTPWNPASGVVVYDSMRLATPAVRGGTATVRATFQRVGRINALGEFRPAAPAPTTVAFRLRNVDGAGWRLTAAPPGIQLERRKVSLLFHRVNLYFLPNQARRVTPTPVFVPAAEQPVTAAARALLAGPRGWLAPAVRSAIPAGTELLEPPSIVDGVASVNLSREVGNAPQEALGGVVAQLVWTLTEPALGVRAVRVHSEGEPLAVPGRPGLRDHRREDWDEYAPVPATADRRLFFVRDGGVYAVDESNRTALIPVPDPVTAVAVNRAGTRLAAVTRVAGGRQALLLVDLTGRATPRQVFDSERIATPTWDPGGDAVWVARTTGGTPEVVVVPADRPGATPAVVAGQLPAGVTALRLSPDGARLALLLRSGEALVARVERRVSGGRALGAPQAVAPSVRGVTAVTFEDPNHLVLAAYRDRRPALYRVDVDGYQLVPESHDGLPAAPVSAVTAAAATAPGSPPELVVSTARRIWRRAPGAAWVAFTSRYGGRGSGATYAG